MKPMGVIEFSAERSADLLNGVVARRHADLEQAFSLINESRAEFRQRLEAEFGRTAEADEADEAKVMLEQRLKQMVERSQAYRDGRIDRITAETGQLADLKHLRAPRFEKAVAKITDAAGGVPRPPAKAMQLMAGGKRHADWNEIIRNAIAVGFQPVPEEETEARDDPVGTVRQGLDSDKPPMILPPLGVCRPTPYDGVVSNSSVQLISNGWDIMDRMAGSGRTYGSAVVAILVPGFGPGQGQLLGDFTLPPGHTNVTVTVDFSVATNLLAFAVVAGAWSVTDLLLTAEASDGTTAGQVQWAGTQVAPGLWGGEQRIRGMRRMVLSRPVPRSGGRLRIGAGSHCYANALPGLIGFADAFTGITVQSICIAAT